MEEKTVGLLEREREKEVIASSSSLSQHLLVSLFSFEEIKEKSKKQEVPKGLTLHFYCLLSLFFQKEEKGRRQ